MPALIVRLVNENNWRVFVANTNISYSFTGETLQMQANSVQAFANMMQERNLMNVDTWLDIDPVIESSMTRNQLREMLTNQLFGATDMVMYGAQVVYGTIGDETLISEGVLEEAGEALMMFLPVPA